MLEPLDIYQRPRYPPSFLCRARVFKYCGSPISLVVMGIVIRLSRTIVDAPGPLLA